MPIDDAARHKLNLDPIEDAHVILVEVQEDGQSAIHRAAINTEDIVSNGETYVASEIFITLPNSSDEEVGVSVSMSNITRVISRAIVRARNRIGLRMMLIDTADPDTYLKDTGNMLVLINVSGNENISGDLAPRASVLEPWPPMRTRKQFFPGQWFT